jgi:hypothetical protein
MERSTLPHPTAAENNVAGRIAVLLSFAEVQNQFFSDIFRILMHRQINFFSQIFIIVKLQTV